MRFDQFIRYVAPLIATAIANGADSAAFECEVKSSGKRGVPLADLDLAGPSPITIALAAPDVVRISEGPEFSIALEGEDEAKERMRFRLENGTLTITRGDTSSVNHPSDQATISITMPPPEKLVIAGAGEMHSDIVADGAEILIAGAGSISTDAVAVDTLDITLAGAGTYNAKGSVGRLKVTVAGAGHLWMEGLKAEQARVKIAGAGKAVFASDGDVKVDILGAGNVTVRGSARCKVRSFGSGALTCERGATIHGDDEEK